MNNRIAEISQNVADGETVKALQAFIKVIDQSDPDKKSDEIKKKLVVLHGELTRANKEYSLGVITNEEKNIRLNKGNSLILTLLNEYLVSGNKKYFEVNLKTIRSFGILAIVTLVIVLLFGNYFYMPRVQDSVSVVLFIIYSFIFAVSILIMLVYAYVNYGVSIRLLKLIILSLICSILFYYAPYISTIYINQESRQDSANNRYLSGNWEEAMYIYIKEENTLNSTSLKNIIEMKRLLNKTGYYLHDINEVPDIRVTESLKKIQKDFGLVPDGYLGRATRNVIFGIIYKKELNIDKENMNVTGITRKVQQFQRLNHIPDDGVIGTQTLKLLDKKNKLDKSKK